MKILTVILNLLDPVIKLINKYGLLKVIIIGGVLSFMIFCSVALFFIYTRFNNINIDVDKSVEKALVEQNDSKAKTHNSAIQKRLNNSDKINNFLQKTMYEVEGDRACIIEMHNGTNNMAGLPFLFGEMTYEQTRRGVEPVCDNYSKLNLVKYTFPLYLNDCGFFRGSIYTAAQTDPHIINKMEKDGTKYIVAYALFGKEQLIGYFVVTWNNTLMPTLTPDKLAIISVTAQKLSNLLDI